MKLYEMLGMFGDTYVRDYNDGSIWKITADDVKDMYGNSLEPSEAFAILTSCYIVNDYEISYSAEKFFNSIFSADSNHHVIDVSIYECSNGENKGYMTIDGKNYIDIPDVIMEDVNRTISETGRYRYVGNYTLLK